MQIRVTFTFFKHALAALSLAVMLTACGGGGDGDGEEHAPELFGSWKTVKLETMSMSTPCPGQISDDFSCSTTFVTFDADGTYVSVDTTDEFGNPFDERTEGTWSSDGNTLTITELEEGPDENNLDPIDPIEPLSFTWSVSANELMVTLDDDPLPAPVTLTLEKQ